MRYLISADPKILHSPLVSPLQVIQPGFAAMPMAGWRTKGTDYLLIEVPDEKPPLTNDSIIPGGTFMCWPYHGWQCVPCSAQRFHPPSPPAPAPAPEVVNKMALKFLALPLCEQIMAILRNDTFGVVNEQPKTDDRPEVIFST